MLALFIEKLSQFFSPLRLDCIQVEVSALCNASCPYCVQACYRDHWKGGLMEMSTFQCLEPDFTRSNLVFLQGWGEPLLHPRFWEMVLRAKAAGPEVGFTTNGTLLDQQNLEQLLDSGVDIMGVSLAGIAPSVHERFRRGADLPRLDKALRALREMKKRRARPQPSVHIAFMLLRSNWHELGQLPELAVQWGVSQIVVSHLNLVGSEAMQEESLLCHPELLPEVVLALEGAAREAANHGIALHYHRPDLEASSAQCTENVLKSLFVSYQGDVSPCVMTNLSLKKDRTPSSYFKGAAYPLENFILGNVTQRPLREIWTSEKARRFRSDFRRRKEMESPGLQFLQSPCQHCYKLLER